MFTSMEPVGGNPENNVLCPFTQIIHVGGVCRYVSDLWNKVQRLCFEKGNFDV